MLWGGLRPLYAIRDKSKMTSIEQVRQVESSIAGQVFFSKDSGINHVGMAGERRSTRRYVLLQIEGWSGLKGLSRQRF